MCREKNEQCEVEITEWKLILKNQFVFKHVLTEDELHFHKPDNEFYYKTS